MNTAPLFSDVASKFDPLAQALAAEARASARLDQVQRLLTAAEARLRELDLSITRAALRGSMPSETRICVVLRGQIEHLQQQVRCASADARWAEVQRRRLEQAA